MQMERAKRAMSNAPSTGVVIVTLTSNALCKVFLILIFIFFFLKFPTFLTFFAVGGSVAV